MTNGNRYFKFRKPIRWFKAVGHAVSTTSYGASRCIDTVHAQTLIVCGDIVHCLCGGTFLVRAAGTVETGRFRLPKPLIEKTYGLPMRDIDLLEQMAVRGLCAEIAKPTGAVDYASGRLKTDARSFPDYTGCVTQDDAVPSPVLGELLRAAKTAKLEAVIRPLGGTLRSVDVGLGPEPETLEACLQIRFEGYRRIDLELSPVSEHLRIRMQDLDGVMKALAQYGPDLPRIDMRSERIAFVGRRETVATMKRLGDILTGCQSPV